ncbi:hypothetical protein AGR13a_Lc120121 [Agrobacterium genomosp. 13 str. CFBP 6927]|uniref:Uncharacterized protein n=1 Tax=Agrobacterium genomosp. 13 str. CFBP 6927 TaxID=1183428 RepID=A0ABP2BPB1_9HYPH|nr:hypothetical protein AGR13a_Lc120121 [Agrobacterium genomosp. 13 str. CFBP 6927]
MNFTPEFKNNSDKSKNISGIHYPVCYNEPTRIGRLF